MQFKYYIANKEVSKNDFENKEGDYVTIVDGGNISATLFSVFFSENNDYYKLLKSKSSSSFLDKLSEQEEDKILATLLNPNLIVNNKVREEWEILEQEQKIIEDLNRKITNKINLAEKLKKESEEIKHNTYLEAQSRVFAGDTYRPKNFAIDNIGKKVTEGKLHYEVSWEFIEEMAKRMANNKSDKYPLYNWKKPMDLQALKDAINRHHIEVMKGNYQDGEEILGHIVQYACNGMMLWEQLNNKKQK